MWTDICDATHIAGNKLVIVMTDVPDIVYMSVGSLLGTSDHCFFSCELLVQQVIAEKNIWCFIHLKHQTIRDNVCNTVSSFLWSTILHSPDPIDAFNYAVSEIVSGIVSTMAVWSRCGDKHWFDNGCHKACDAKQTANYEWDRAHRVDSLWIL